MVEENRETAGEIPESDDWARRPQEAAQKLRAIAGRGREGLDGRKLLLGFALDTICGDDIHVFRVGSDHFTAEKGEKSRNDLLIRLEWEAGMGELPEEIRQRLGNLQETFRTEAWQTIEDLASAAGRWLAVRSDVVLSIRREPELKEATDYYRRLLFEDRLSEAF